MVMATETAAPTSMVLLMPNGQNGMVATTSLTSTAGTGGMNIKLTFADGNTETVFWNGTNSQGQLLQPGNYMATLSQSEAGSSEVVKTESFVILGGKDTTAQDMAGTALVVPNPVDGGSFTVEYQPSAPDTAAGVLYNLAGQKVGEATDNGGGSLVFTGNWSGGVYLLDFEVRNGSGVLARRILKVAVVR